VKPQWDSVFAALRDAGRFVLAVDEFGHWLDVDPGVLSILQRGWDEYLADSQVFLILLTSADFLPTYRASELAVAYAVSNGVPHYLALFNGERGLEENLAFLFSRWGPLYEEAENLLRHEVREPHVYLNIVRAMEEAPPRIPK
jgi:AAA+ ATPase superfamily predicted ATPase